MVWFGPLQGLQSQAPLYRTFTNNFFLITPARKDFPFAAEVFGFPILSFRSVLSLVRFTILWVDISFSKYRIFLFQFYRVLVIISWFCCSASWSSLQLLVMLEFLATCVPAQWSFNSFYESLSCCFDFRLSLLSAYLFPLVLPGFLPPPHLILH